MFGHSQLSMLWEHKKKAAPANAVNDLTAKVKESISSTQRNLQAQLDAAKREIDDLKK